jgi:prepilin-type N-terminal cleavage/methylation domain-containing protein
MSAGHGGSRQRAGFTLIELLASLAVVLIMVGLAAAVFAQAEKAWARGVGRAEQNMVGRAALDRLVRELNTAVADEAAAMRLVGGTGTNTCVTYGRPSDELWFVTANRPAHTPGRRGAEETAYFVRPMQDEADRTMAHRFRLVRAARRAEAGYADPSGRWWRDWRGRPPNEPADLVAFETVAENVALFSVRAFHPDVSERPVPDYDSLRLQATGAGQGLPAWIEIYLALLGDDQAAVAAFLWDTAASQASRYVERHARRYAVRSFPIHRDGHSLEHR